MRKCQPSCVDEVVRYYAARSAEYDATAGYYDIGAEELRKPMKARYGSLLAGRDVLEIGCGTGYWTDAMAGFAKSIVATDINPSMVALAQSRLKARGNVTLRLADAYSLDGIRGGFTAALGMWWWSHMPKSRVRAFLTTLHHKLAAGAMVLFADELPTVAQMAGRRLNADGDCLETRTLKDGSMFSVVKNVPTAGEIVSVLDGLASNISFQQYPDAHLWDISYKVVDQRSDSASLASLMPAKVRHKA